MAGRAEGMDLRDSVDIWGAITSQNEINKTPTLYQRNELHVYIYIERERERARAEWGVVIQILIKSTHYIPITLNKQVLNIFVNVLARVVIVILKHHHEVLSPII